MATAAKPVAPKIGEEGTVVKLIPISAKLPIAAVIVDGHNEARKLIREGKAHSAKWGDQPAGPEVADLTYSYELAKSAAKHAEKCRFRGHSKPEESRCGESLSSPHYPDFDKAIPMSQKIGEDAIKGWIHTERDKYGYSPRTKGKFKCVHGPDESWWAPCGHYTQAIEERAKEIGCAFAQCNNKGALWSQLVCHYDQCGNGLDSVPYKVGEPKKPEEKKKNDEEEEIEKEIDDEAEKLKKLKERKKQMELEKKGLKKKEFAKDKTLKEKEKEKEKKSPPPKRKKVGFTMVEKDPFAHLKSAGLDTAKEKLVASPVKSKSEKAVFEDFGTYYDLNDLYGDYGYFDSYDDGYYVDKSAADTQKAYEYLVDPGYDAVGVGEYYPHSGTDNEWMLTVSLMVNIGLFILLLGAICCIFVIVYGYLLNKLSKSEEDMIRKSRRMSEV